MKKLVAWCLGITFLLGLVSPVFAAKKDTINPFVTNSNPFDAQINVMVDNRIVLQFNEPVMKGRAIAQIRIKEAEATNISYTYDIKANVLQLTAKKNLKPGTAYRVIIPAAAIKDMNGNNLKEDLSLDFITESEASALGHTPAKPEEELKSNHIIEMEVDMEGSLSNAEEEYLIASMKAIGIKVTEIHVNEIEEEAIDDQQEESEGSAEATLEEEEEIGQITEYDVLLVDCGTNKVEVIRVLRLLTGLSLAEAKRLADQSDISPQIVREGISDYDARSAAKSLEDAGATVTIIDHEVNE